MNRIFQFLFLTTLVGCNTAPKHNATVSSTVKGLQKGTAYLQKFKDKYETQKDELQSKIENPSLSSSNLELAIDKALTSSESLEKIWVDGDLKQRQKLQHLVFLSGLGYDKSNDRVRTPKVNAIFGSIPILSKEISNIKKGEPIPVNQFSDCVTQKESHFFHFLD